jgi:hypothetical protein
MSSPFISVSRRRKRFAGPSRPTTIAALAVVALLGMVVPALGGPRAFSAASPITLAKRALRTANKANKKSSKALLLATKGPKNESITSAKIANLTIKNEDLSAGAVGSGKIANGAIRSVDVGDGQITNGKIADGAIGTAKIANGAVTAADIAGADIHGSIHGDAGAVSAQSCTTALIVLGGAQVGDVAFFSFTGDIPVPQGLTFQILKVTAPNEGTMRFCNPTNSPSPAFSGVGIRVLTFR